MNSAVGCHHLLPGPQWHTSRVINPAVGRHYFPPGPQLPSQQSGVITLRPVATYTAWWQRHIGVRHLPRVLRHEPSWESKPQPLDRKSNTLHQCTATDQQRPRHWLEKKARAAKTHVALSSCQQYKSGCSRSLDTSWRPCQMETTMSSVD